MIITCEECNSSFSINDNMIKDTGSKVRCSKCDNVFVAFPQSTEDELMLGEDEDLGLDDLEAVTFDLVWFHAFPLKIRFLTANYANRANKEFLIRVYSCYLWLNFLPS